jgi:transcriptional regulator with XRE-family HTH domain
MKSGIAREDIARLETGNNDTSVSILEKLATALKAKAREFVE